ncbi:MAG: chorismate binding enzyme, partial [Acidimicrobiaceae bacterium]
RLVAGCGIVSDSDPATELEESRTKLQALLGAIVRP